MGPFLVNIAPSMFHVASPFLISFTPTHQSLGETSTFVGIIFAKLRPSLQYETFLQ